MSAPAGTDRGGDDVDKGLVGAWHDGSHRYMCVWTNMGAECWDGTAPPRRHYTSWCSSMNAAGRSGESGSAYPRRAEADGRPDPPLVTSNTRNVDAAAGTDRMSVGLIPLKSRPLS